jgi:hypothetical protein
MQELFCRMFTTQVSSRTLDKEESVIGVIEAVVFSPQHIFPAIGKHVITAHAPAFTFNPPMNILIFTIEESNHLVIKDAHCITQYHVVSHLVFFMSVIEDTRLVIQGHPCSVYEIGNEGAPHTIAHPFITMYD